MMKAVVFEKYGTPGELSVRDVPIPRPGDGEVLVRVCAVSLNSSDAETLAGSPLYVRLLWGFRKPRCRILGSDIAGVVESVGPEVRRLKPGDAVFGDALERMGGFAEYVCLPERLLTLKPASMPFDVAAALPQSSIIALQGLCGTGTVTRGRRVLINGAGGGGGSFAIQIAKLHGAHVTAVDSTVKCQFMRSLGADRVIDCSREDFADSSERFDLILDFVARRPLRACRRMLVPGGRYVVIGGHMRQLLATALLGSALSLVTSRKSTVCAVEPNRGIGTIIDLIEAGRLHAAISHRYTLEQVPDAFRVYAAGMVLGKAVIVVRE